MVRVILLSTNDLPLWDTPLLYIHCKLLLHLRKLREMIINTEYLLSPYYCLRIAMPYIYQALNYSTMFKEKEKKKATTNKLNPCEGEFQIW